LRIHFFVGLQREAVAYLLASAELCVQAALAESFPLAVLEAGATGTPLAATNISGHDELIEDRATGRLFRSADPADCHRVISEMLSDPHATRAVAVALRSLVLDSFTWKHCVCAYGELYANSREFL
jgi:glycosyltransferase involved in cell wall biosynthesis